MLCIPLEILYARVLPYSDFLTMMRVARCSIESNKEVLQQVCLCKARKLFIHTLLLEAGAPTSILMNIDASKSIQWMHKLNLERCGYTGYIDNITSEEFPKDKPVLYGKDPHQRFYIALRYIWRGRSGIACLFQRYTEDSEFFVNCCDCISDRTVFTSRFVTVKESRHSSRSMIAKHHTILLELATNGMVTLESGEDVILYSED